MISRRFLRVKALKALYGYKCDNEDSVSMAQKKMLFSISKSYELYHLMMQLIVDIADYAAQTIETAKNKHLATPQELNPNMRFVENKLIAKIRSCEPLQAYLTKNTLAWNKDNDFLKHMYSELISTRYYEKYMNSEETSFDIDKKLVTDFYRTEIENDEFLHDTVEDMSIYWIDDIEFLTSKVISTLNYVTENGSLRIPNLYQKDDDKDFVRDLFSESIIHFDDNAEIIRKYSQNWDLERVTVMDRLIIVMAIVEFNSFPSIPARVTIDEYLELAKMFSTHNSSIYINGILDKYIKDNNITK